MIRKFFSRLRRDKRGQGLVEYALLIAGVTLICAGAVAIFGHKTNDMIAAVAAIMPGAHTDDNGPIVSGKIITTTPASGTGAAINVNAIATQTGTDRLGGAFGSATTDTGVGGLITEAAQN
jgi:pilus assembly protein Flp/PilA